MSYIKKTINYVMKQSDIWPKKEKKEAKREI